MTNKISGTKAKTIKLSQVRLVDLSTKQLFCEDFIWVRGFYIIPQKIYLITVFIYAHCTIVYYQNVRSKMQTTKK